MQTFFDTHFPNSSVRRSIFLPTFRQLPRPPMARVPLLRCSVRISPHLTSYSLWPIPAHWYRHHLQRRLRLHTHWRMVCLSSDDGIDGCSCFDLGNNDSSTITTAKPSKQGKMSSTETSSIRVLVNAYREAASYLCRSADELEQMLWLSFRSRCLRLCTCLFSLLSWKQTFACIYFVHTCRFHQEVADIWWNQTKCWLISKRLTSIWVKQNFLPRTLAFAPAEFCLSSRLVRLSGWRSQFLSIT